MKVTKVARRIQIEIRYGDPLQPKIKARGYKWDAQNKVWWKGYTDDEMAWAQQQQAGKQETAQRMQERRTNAVKLTATYKQTEFIKDDLLAIGCFIDSTGERVWSQSKGEYVFAKAWFAPTDKVERANAIIEHGGAAKADAAAARLDEARVKREKDTAELREFATQHGFTNAATIKYGSWSADFRFATATEDGYCRAIVRDSKTGVLHLIDASNEGGTLPARTASARLERSIREAEAIPAAKEVAARYGRVATGAQRSLRWIGRAGLAAGQVIHTSTCGWVLVVEVKKDRISQSDIDAREEMDDFSGRQTPGVETYATAIPVEPLGSEVAAKTGADAEKKIRDAARTANSLAADDARYADTDAYRTAIDNLRRLEAGESAVSIAP